MYLRGNNDSFLSKFVTPVFSGITCAIHLHSGKKVASVAECTLTNSSSGLIWCVLFDGK